MTLNDKGTRDYDLHLQELFQRPNHSDDFCQAPVNNVEKEHSLSTLLQQDQCSESLAEDESIYVEDSSKVRQNGP